MRAINLRRFLAAILLGTVIMITAGGCGDDAVEEIFTGEGAGWTAILFLSNTCKFGEGRFDDPNCRFRNVNP